MLYKDGAISNYRKTRTALKMQVVRLTIQSWKLKTAIKLTASQLTAKKILKSKYHHKRMKDKISQKCCKSVSWASKSTLDSWNS